MEEEEDEVIAIGKTLNLSRMNMLYFIVPPHKAL